MNEAFSDIVLHKMRPGPSDRSRRRAAVAYFSQTFCISVSAPDKARVLQMLTIRIAKHATVKNQSLRCCLNMRWHLIVPDSIVHQKLGNFKP